MMNLTRDASTGRILSNNVPIVLRGGHYFIFKHDDKPGRCLVKTPLPAPPAPALPFRVEYTIPPCKLVDFPVAQLTWAPEPWTMFFDQLKAFDCNFLRLWLMGGTEVEGTGLEAKPLDLTPFTGRFVGGKWKWQVHKPVTTNMGWNDNYFRKLELFVRLAEESGIAVQISLFNYFDLTLDADPQLTSKFRVWCRSPWNPTLSENPSTDSTWGNKHLVNVAGDYTACNAVPNDTAERARQDFFIKPNNSLPLVQQALVKKTLATLKGRTNVIYEVMNETRGTHPAISAFNTKVVGWIDAATADWAHKPLISVNATMLAGGVFDVDYWRDHPNPQYHRVDAISYHGLTGFPSLNNRTVCCQTKQSIPPVNPESIQARYELHFPTNGQAGHKSKSLIYCTDAVYVKALRHIYKDAAGIEYELEVRDGQFFTRFPNVSDFSPYDKRLKSDLQNWAFWCFSSGAKTPGTAHFQNHSLNQITYRRIRDAMVEATAAPLLNIEAIEPSEQDE
jgi:hypothetical protein